MGPFRCVDYSPIFGVMNLAPLIRANTVQLSRADLQPLAKRGPSEGWNRRYFIKVGVGGCLLNSFVLRRPQERLNGLQAELIWHFGAEADLFNFHCTDIEVVEPSVQGR